MSDDGNKIGLLDAVAVEVGLIVGGALFGLVGVGISIAGSGVVVSFGIAITIAVLGLVPTAMLGASFPTTCGHYRYPSRFVSPSLGFVGAFGLGVSMFAGGLPLYALTAGEYLNGLVSVPATVTGLVLLTFFFVINLFGIRPAARAQTLMFVGLVAALVAFVALGVPEVEASNLSSPFANGFVGVVAGAGVLYFTCLGANFVIDIGGDLRDAAVTIPRSFAVSIPLVLILYVLVAAVAVGTVGVGGMSNETLMLPAERFLSPAFQTFFIIAGAVFAVATSLNAAYILVPRYVEALAHDGVVPRVLGRKNERFGTAHWALFATYAVSCLVMLAPLPFEDLGTVLAFGGALVVTVVMLAAVSVLRQPPPGFEPDAFPVPNRLVLGMAVVAIPLNVALILLLATQSTTLFVGWLAVLVVGFAYYFVRTNYYTPSQA
jgi:APA family basic amino acid/polyamine antiporter